MDDYKEAGVPPQDVWLQSFNLDAIKYWIAHAPEFGSQAVYLDDRYSNSDADEARIDPMNAASFRPSMGDLKRMGVNYIGPPLWMLVTLKDGKILPSVYAKEAKAAGLDIITWSLDRSGPFVDGGDWYTQSISQAILSSGMVYELLNVLDAQVGVVGVFSDWPGTVSYDGSCMAKSDPCDIWWVWSAPGSRAYSQRRSL